jgi:hypothetical protein
MASSSQTVNVYQRVPSIDEHIATTSLSIIIIY